MPIATPIRTAALDAYERLAPFYDSYTHHNAYAGWILRLEALARRHGLTGKRALDVGCGTGKSLSPLLELGYDAVGCDPSPAMLRAAQSKLDGQAELTLGGLPALPRLGSFDYVTCLNDVLNYVARNDLGTSFSSLAGNLRPGGVLLFDTSTLALYRQLFATDHVRRSGRDVFAWSARTPADVSAGSSPRAWLDVFAATPDGRYERFGAEQVQQHHPEDDVRAALAAAGLSLAAVYGQRDDGHPAAPLSPDRHTKAIWVVHRP